MSIPQQDLIAGVDLTGRTEVNESELTQLVNAARPATGRGFPFRTTDTWVGDAVTGVSVPDLPPSMFSNYIWRRIKVDHTGKPAGTIVYAWDEANIHQTGELQGTGWQPTANLTGGTGTGGAIGTADVQFFDLNSTSPADQRMMRLNALSLKGQGYLPIEKAVMASETIDVRIFGYIGDGQRHPLSDKYATVAEARAAYPNFEYKCINSYDPAGVDMHIQLTDQQDWAAIQEACAYVARTEKEGTDIYIPVSHAILNRCIIMWEGCVLSGQQTSPRGFGLISTAAYVWYKRGVCLDFIDDDSPWNPYLGVVGDLETDDQYDSNGSDLAAILRSNVAFNDNAGWGTSGSTQRKQMTFKCRSGIYMGQKTSIKNITILFSDQQMNSESKTALKVCGYAISLVAYANIINVFIVNAYRGILIDWGNGNFLANLTIHFCHRGLVLRGQSLDCYYNNISFWHGPESSDSRYPSYPSGNSDAQNDELRKPYSEIYESDNFTEHRLREGIAILVTADAQGPIFNNIIVFSGYSGLAIGSAWVHFNNVILDKVVRPVYIYGPIALNVFSNINIIGASQLGWGTADDMGWGGLEYWPCYRENSSLPYGYRRNWAWHPGNQIGIEIITSEMATINFTNVLLSGYLSTGILVNAGRSGSTINFSNCSMYPRYSSSDNRVTNIDGVMGPHLIVTKDFLGRLTYNGDIDMQRVFVYQDSSFGWAGRGRVSSQVTINGRTAPYIGSEILTGQGWPGQAKWGVLPGTPENPGMLGYPLNVPDPLFGRIQYRQGPITYNPQEKTVPEVYAERTSAAFDNAVALYAPIMCTHNYTDSNGKERQAVLKCVNSTLVYTVPGRHNSRIEQRLIDQITPGHRIAEKAADAALEDPGAATAGAENVVWEVQSLDNVATGMNNPDNWEVIPTKDANSKNYVGRCVTQTTGLDGNGIRISFATRDQDWLKYWDPVDKVWKYYRYPLNPGASNTTYYYMPDTDPSIVRKYGIMYRIPQMVGCTAHPAILSFEISSFIDDPRWQGMVDRSGNVLKTLFVGICRKFDESGAPSYPIQWFKELSNFPDRHVPYPAIAGVYGGNPDCRYHIRVTIPFYLCMDQESYFFIQWSNQAYPQRTGTTRPWVDPADGKTKTITDVPEAVADIEANYTTHVELRDFKVHWAEVIDEADFVYWCGQDTPVTYPRGTRNYTRAVLFPKDFCDETPVLLSHETKVAGYSFRRLKSLTFELASYGYWYALSTGYKGAMIPGAWDSWRPPGAAEDVLQIYERVGANLQYHCYVHYELELWADFLKKACNERCDWTRKDLSQICMETNMLERLGDRGLIAKCNHPISRATLGMVWMALQTNVKYGGWKLRCKEWEANTNYYEGDYMRTPDGRRIYKAYNSGVSNSVYSPDFDVLHIVGNNIADGGATGVIWYLAYVKPSIAMVTSMANTIYETGIANFHGAWFAGHVYAENELVYNADRSSVFKCTTAGEADVSEPFTPANSIIGTTGIIDKVARWECVWASWQPGVTYTAGNLIYTKDRSRQYVCLKNGTSNASTSPIDIVITNTDFLIGDHVSDNTTEWMLTACTTGYRQPGTAYAKGAVVESLKSRMCLVAKTGGITAATINEPPTLSDLRQGQVDSNGKLKTVIDGTVEWACIGYDSSVEFCTPIMVTAEWEFESTLTLG